MANFNLDFDELAKIDGIPKDNLTFRINIDDLVVDWDDELGSGSFAQVFRAWYLYTEVAVKKMILPIEEQDKVLIKYFKREVVLLKYVLCIHFFSILPDVKWITPHTYQQCSLIKHPNIVQFLGWCHPEDSNHLLIVEGLYLLLHHIISNDLEGFRVHKRRNPSKLYK
jgi:serine/threonine protein kinase